MKKKCKGDKTFAPFSKAFAVFDVFRPLRANNLH